MQCRHLPIYKRIISYSVVYRLILPILLWGGKGTAAFLAPKAQQDDNRCPNRYRHSSNGDDDSAIEAVVAPTALQIFQDDVQQRIHQSMVSDSSSQSWTMSQEVDLSEKISFSAMDHSKSDQATEIEELVRKMTENGGYIIVEVGGESHHHSTILQDMWTTLADFFALQDNSDSDTTELYRQILQRDEEEPPNELGYDYIQMYTSPNGSILPSTILDELNKKRPRSSLSTYRRGIQDSFYTLANLGLQLSSLLVSNICKVDDGRVDHMWENLLHDETRRFSCCNHRLARYLPATPRGGDHDDQQHEESLRPHTDWTIATVIPLSQTPGQQVWNSQHQKWRTPEVMVPQHHQGRLHHDTSYVVVLAGKWLELMTNGKIPACVHRVMVTSQQRRLSAPFFLRPTEKVSNQLQELCNTRPLLSSKGTTASVAVDSIFQAMFSQHLELKGLR